MNSHPVIASVDLLRRRTKVPGRFHSRRRRPPLVPRPFVGTGAFRAEHVDGEVYVIGPGGRREPALEEYARWLFNPPQDEDFRTTRKQAQDGLRAVLEFVNWLHPKQPDVVERLLLPHAKPARDLVRNWTTMLRCERDMGGNAQAGILIASPDEVHFKVTFAISKLGQMFDLWRRTGRRDAPNPLKMDKEHSRLEPGRQAILRKTAVGYRVDTDRMFRMRSKLWRPARPEDPTIPARILEGGRRAGWPEAVQLLVEGCAIIGPGRVGELRVMNLFELLHLPADDRHAMIRNKNGKGRPTKKVFTPAGWRERVLDMVRRAIGNEKFAKALAAAKLSHRRAAWLKKVHVFSLDGGISAVSYGFVNDRCFRPVIEELGLFVPDLGDGSRRPVRRWVTIHWLRHMWVNRALDSIARSPLDAEGKRAAREVLGERIMGWKSWADMLRYYGEWQLTREVDQLVSDLDDEANEVVAKELQDCLFVSPGRRPDAWAQALEVAGDLLEDA